MSWLQQPACRPRLIFGRQPLHITSLAVRRPVAVVALFVAVAVAGLMAYSSLPINWFPKVNVPVVTIVTIFPGAGPEEVELQVTRPIEDAVAGLSDLDTL